DRTHAPPKLQHFGRPRQRIVRPRPARDVTVRPMVHLRSTRNCPNTPRVRFALEEMGVPYELELVPDGTFTREYGIPGPELVEGDARIVEVNAILRHVARRHGA